MNGKTEASGETAPAGSARLAEAAGRVLENLGELEPQLINAGIFDGERNPVATTAGSDAWSKGVAELLAALEAGSGDEKFDSAHVASAEGEVFVVSEAGLSLVAVTSRFVLASLTSYDMRMVLRDAVRAGNPRDGEEASSGAEKKGPGDA